jgi:acyl-CoA thioesterase-1
MRTLFNKTLTILLGLMLGQWLLLPAVQAEGFKKPQLAPIVLVVGDSVSAEYGLKRGSGWVSLLQNTIIKENLPHKVVNASISGETTSGGASRIDATYKTACTSHCDCGAGRQ